MNTLSSASLFWPCGGRRRPLFWNTLALVGLVGLGGCGSSGTYPVSGKLAWTDGSPATELAGGAVVFESEDQPVTARSAVHADGTFRLSTRKPNDGAPPGHYRIIVFQPPEKGNDGVPRKKILHERFGSLDTSGLRATVEPKSNEIDLTIERARGGKR